MLYRAYEASLVTRTEFDALWGEITKSGHRPERDDSQPAIPRWKRATWAFSPTVLTGLIEAERRGSLPVRSLVAALDIAADDLNRLSPI